MKQLLSLRKYLRPYRWEAVLALVLLTSIVVMDLALPRLIQRIIDQGIGGKNLQVVINTSLIMLALALLSTLFAVGNNILSVRVGEGLARDLREALFLCIQSFSFGNLDRLKTGQLIVRLTSDISVVQRMARLLLRIGTRAPLLMIGSLALMIATNSTLALKMLPILLVTAVVLVIFIPRMGSLFTLVQKKLDGLNTVLQENISGVRLVKAFVRTDYENGRFEKANDEFTRQTVSVMRVMAVLSPLLMILLNIGIVVSIWGGGLQVIQGDLTLGKIVAFGNYLLTTMTPLAIFANLSQTLAAANASAERINEVLDAEPEVQEAPDALHLSENQATQVVFENVSFSYNGAREESVLQEINLRANPGEMVAILGATGAGKTTLVNLIPRFYDVTRGRVLVGGVDVRQIEQDSLLAQVGMVPQETVLFSGTVSDNIRYGRSQASDDEVITAAKAAQAHEFILELPQGYDTRIEQRGVNLSGGQKQRIAIARAILTQPKILILDDSTSSVDVETETKIQDALVQIMRGRTSFVIAQRISTVLNANKIVILEKGRIVAEGTHAELMQSSPVYKEIFDSQLGNGLQLEQLK
jgi:ATP-binding cassette subfamily B multidrug efflux pump